ncbi:hypothetical protein GGF37_006428, partial [Kickxella alabastrina]
RDAIINNHGPVGYPAGYPHGYLAGYYPSQVYYPPYAYAPAPVVRYTQPPYTVGIPAAHIEHKAQSASIVQNQN